GPSAVDVHIDVAVEIGDVQHLLEVVGRDVALGLECLQTLLGSAGRTSGLRRRLGVLHAVGHGHSFTMSRSAPRGPGSYTSREGNRRAPVSARPPASSSPPSSSPRASPPARAWSPHPSSPPPASSP